jgi:hypothetical protein
MVIGRPRGPLGIESIIGDVVSHREQQILVSLAASVYGLGWACEEQFFPGDRCPEVARDLFRGQHFSSFAQVFRSFEYAKASR